MDNGAPSLEVGFAIETGGSFDELLRLQQVMDSTEAKVVADASKIERATTGMLNLGGATAQLSSFGNAATRELQSTAREMAKAEKSGESLSRQLARQSASFGKSSEELRRMKVETAALAAEQQGLTELAGRLRTQEAALYDAEFAAARRARIEADNLAEDRAIAAQKAVIAVEAEAQAIRSAAFAHNMFEAAARKGSQAMREHEAAAAAAAREEGNLANAAGRLRASIDPAYAAQQRFDAEMATARTLVSANAITLDEYVAKLRLEQAALDVGGSALGRHTASAGANRAAMAGASYQLQDFMTQVSMGANPINALAVQGGQLAGQFSNIEGKAGGVARFFIGPWGLAITGALLVLGPLVGKLLESNNALDDATDKLKKDARETEATRIAKEQFKTSVEGVAAAIRDGTDATNKSITALRSAAENANIDAKVNLNREIQIRQTTAALLEQALAQERVDQQRSQAPGQRGELASLSAAVSSNRAALLQSQLDANQRLISEAERRVQATRVDLAVETAKQISTAEGRITRDYDNQIKAIQATAYAQAKAGQAIDGGLTRQIVALERARDVAVKAEGDKQKAYKQTADQIGRNITLAEGRSIAQGAGGRITSDHRDTATQQRLYAKYLAYKAGNGPWAALAAKPGSSYHELDQAVDVAKSDGVTLKKLIGAYRAAGVKLVEALDEGDHYHIAWGKVGDEAKAQTAAASAAAREIKEAARAAQQQVSEAENFASSLNDETGKIGKTAIEIKQIEVAAAAAKAPTEALRDAITQAGLAWETAMSLHDLASVDLTEGMNFQLPETDAVTTYLRQIQDGLDAVAARADTTGQIMANAFGHAGDVLGTLIANLADYRARQAEVNAMPMGSPERLKQEKALAALQARNTAQAISGIKSLFKEHSAAYKIMSGIEKAYAAFQAAETIASIARDILKTTSSVANSGVRTAANTGEGASKIFAELGPWAFPVVAAMIAVLVALGARGGGGGGGGPSIPTAEDIQTATGTGTVLGDGKAKSDSIQRSLEIVAANTNKDLEYSNQMLKALRNIDFSIAKLAGTVAQQITVSGSLFDTTRLSLGSTGSGGFLGLFSSSTTRELWDAGLNFAATTVAGVLNGSIGGSSYQTVQQIRKKSGFFGIGGSTRTSYITTTGSIDGDITSAVANVIISLRDGLIAGANVIGLPGAQAILDAFQVNLGQISLKGLTGKEIEEQFQAIFSKLGDQMAATLIPSLSSLQLVGEGLFETFSRVAREYAVVDYTLQAIGKSFGAVGVSSIAARDQLVQLFDSLDEFVSQTEYFGEHYLTEAERIAPVASSVIAELARLGMAGIHTRDQFKATVLGLDLTTDAGRNMYASLLAVAPAFDKVIGYFDNAGKSTRDELQKTADQFNGFVASLTKYRDTLSALTQTQAEAYGALKAKFTATAALAATGDATALGGLEASGKAFLDNAKNNASTFLQYQRDVALVRAGVDQGIFAAESTADYAELQLAALTNVTSILQTISTNTAATVAALAVPLPPPAAPPVPDNSAVTDALAGLQSDLNAGLVAIAGTNATVARLLTRFDGDGLLVRTDRDSPLATTAIP